MLFLIFHLGANRYALEANRVEEVLSLVEIQSLPGASRDIAGLFNYRGRPVPALDLCELMLQRPACERLSTRLIVVKCPGRGQTQRLGLIVEQVSGFLRRDREAFVDAGMRMPSVPYLGPVIADTQGLIQLLREDRLLAENVREPLFTQPLLSPP